MPESDLEKTELPTQRRLEEARDEGNVARSADLTAALSLLVAVLLLNVFGMKMLAGMKVSIESVLAGALTRNPTQGDDLTTLMSFAGRIMLESLAPLLLALAAVALVATVGQVGFRVTGKPVMPDLMKLSPIKGLKNMFGMRAGVRLVMSMAKVTLIALVALWVVHQDLPQIVTLAELDVMPLFGVSSNLVYGLALKLAVLLILLAVFDYAFQRWRRTQDLKMSKHEVKEEMKRMEGDPLVKQRRARVARQLAMQRIGQAVPDADVIVTNPTHFAVALRYESATMRAPKVVAKGADLMAMRIRQLAALHGVPIVERKEVARALYRTVEVGQEVPPEFYNAIAEILAYVYRVSSRQSA